MNEESDVGPATASRQFLSAMQLELSKFLYEPMDNRTADMIRESVADKIRENYGETAVCGVDIDDMRDLDYRSRECRACAETSSYEEYRVRRAALNLPDDAGSEKEWRRMSQYRPGTVVVNVKFAPVATQEIDCSFRLA